MNEEPRLNLRLSPDDEGDMLILDWLNQFTRRGEKSQKVREAILSSLTGVLIQFDAKDPNDKRIIEEIEHFADEPRRLSQWIKARLWERLTGLDSITGEPLEQFIKVVETERVVIQERIRTIEVPTYGIAPVVNEQEKKESGLNESAHNQLTDLEW